MLVYRHAAYDTPWWSFPSSRDGRFHRATIDTVQYLCLHPLGPAAEVLRQQVGPQGNPDDVTLNLWAADVDLDNVAHVTFDNSEALGIEPDQLVGDDYRPTQLFAETMRTRGASGLRVPSAALPGTETVVLFGARVLHPYLLAPIPPDEIRTGHLSDGARSPAEVAALVRWRGHPHRALEQWQATGTFDVLDDPSATRW